VLTTVALVGLAGIAAGTLGALLGIGGAILLVPIVHIGLGYPIFTAATVGLMTVLGTSVSVSSATASQRLVNVRLALVLLVAAVAGALGGVHAVTAFVSERAAELVYGFSSVAIAMVMLWRLDRRNITVGELAASGPLDGCYDEYESGCRVSYRVRRLPLAIAAAGLAGMLSSIAGVGGGMVIVPVLNSWCGVPLRVAAVTSAFMIGVTAVPGLVGHYQLGHLTTPELAAAAVLGVLAGARAGLLVSDRSPVRNLKLLMAGLLAAVGTLYVVRGSL
jgi:uncharacterized membrane protein YfcA